jgi:uncharacterized protein with von Willebrand factor type A (vWA) domain
VPERAVTFARALRTAGLDVPPGSALTYARALDAVGLDDRDAVYWAGRATLVRRPEDAPTYDLVFTAFWGGGRTVRPPEHERPPPPPMAVDDEDDTGDAATGDGDVDPLSSAAIRWSAREVLRHKDLATCTPGELVEAARLVDRLRLAGPRRRSRRRRPAGRGELDLRRTAAIARRAGGEPIRLARRAPSDRLRRLVVLVDVSGSMAPYTRTLLRFAAAAVAARRQVEVFALGTRLTRLTAALATHDPDAALRAAAAAVPDLEGGTRLGETLRAFNDRWGVRGTARGATVVVLSDGWDRGDPAVLGDELERLHRVAHRIVWVNPLKASPGYAPLAGGMAAALPHVDGFVEGHSVASIEALADLLTDAPGRARWAEAAA